MLPETAIVSVQKSDWAKLASSLGAKPYVTSQVQELFYPKRDNDGNENSSVHSSTPPNEGTARRKGFFGSLDEEGYSSLYQCVLKCDPPMQFLDIQSFLNVKKDEGEVMVQVMDHVVRWFNDQPADIIDRQENNKLPRRQDLITAFEKSTLKDYGSDAWEWLTDRGRSDGCDSIASWADKHSRFVEQQVLDFTRHHMAEFKGPSMHIYLDQLPEEYEITYADRFDVEDLWKELLSVVRKAVPSELFRPIWQERSVDRQNGTDGISGLSRPDNETRRQPASAITRAICSQVGKIPEVAQNPALSAVDASVELGALIDKAVLTWAAKRCRWAIENSETEDGSPLSSESKNLIQLAHQNYEKLLSQRATTSLSTQRPAQLRERLSQMTDEDPTVIVEGTTSSNQPSEQYGISQETPATTASADERREVQLGNRGMAETAEPAEPPGLSQIPHSSRASRARSPQAHLRMQQRTYSPGQVRKGHTLPVLPVAEVGRPLQLPGASGAVRTFPANRRKSLPSGKQKAKRPETATHSNLTSHGSASASWMGGPIATSGNRR